WPPWLPCCWPPGSATGRARPAAAPSAPPRGSAPRPRSPRRPGASWSGSPRGPGCRAPRWRAWPWRAPPYRASGPRSCGHPPGGHPVGRQPVGRVASVLRAARASRSGGALGTAAGLGSTALIAAGAVGLLILIATVLSVLSAGVPNLALALLAYSGLGALVVVAGFAASLAAPSLVDGAEVERGLRDAGTSAAIGPRVVLLLTAGLPALAVVGTVVSSLQSAPRTETVWEDRALHAVTPMSLPLLGGVALGAVTVLLVTASLLDASRRSGALA